MDAPLERAALLAIFAFAGTVLGFLLGRYRPAEGVVVVADAEPPKHPGLAAAGRKGVAAFGMNTDRFRCGTCGMESTKGPLTRHQRTHHHEGMEPL